MTIWLLLIVGAALLTNFDPQAVGLVAFFGFWVVGTFFDG